MKLIRRQVNLIKSIIENPNVGMRELGEITNVSTQTVKADLMRLKDFLQRYGTVIEPSQNNNLRIWGKEHLPYILRRSKLMLEFPLEKQILLLMLFSDNFIVLQDIADKLYVSKSLAEKIMASLLKKYPDELESVRHYGIRNIASAIQKRSRFAEILKPYMRGIDFEKELKEFNVRHFPILRYITLDDIITGQTVLDYVKNDLSGAFTDKAICQLFLQIIYIKFCMRKKNKKAKGPIFSYFAHDMKANKQYLGAASTVSSIVGVTDKNEKDYFCYLFMTLRKQNVADTTQFISVMQLIISEIFQKINEQMSIDFSEDKKLIKGLSVHIYTTVLRRDLLKNFSFEYSNNEIMHQYPIGFEMAAIAAKSILKKFTYKVSVGELMYLTLHFQAALERMKSKEKKLKILVVCHYGMAAASLIAAKIERLFHNIEVIDTTSVQEFMQMNKSDADLVLSTENISSQDISVIYITPLLTQTELKQISHFIEMHCMNNLLALFILNAIVIDIKSAASRDELIKKAAAVLYKTGIVTRDYVASCIERENISSTDIDFIAIPHGSPDFVKETKLMIVRLKEPLLWESSKVKYVFMFAISKEQFSKNFALFSKFYKKLANSTMRNKLKKLAQSSKKDFKQNMAQLLSL